MLQGSKGDAVRAYLRHVRLGVFFAAQLAVEARRLLLLLLDARNLLRDLGEALLARARLAPQPVRLARQVAQLVLQRVQHLR